MSPAQFETYEALILSGQIGHREAVALLRSHPEFERWYLARANRRNPPSTTLFARGAA